MSPLAAQLLASQIRSTHPHLHPQARTIGNGETIVRLEQTQYRKTVGFWHCWTQADWQLYLQSITPKQRRREAS